jgi:hypothetical protein
VIVSGKWFQPRESANLPLPAGGKGGIEARLTLTLHPAGLALAPALLGVIADRVFKLLAADATRLEGR